MGIKINRGYNMSKIKQYNKWIKTFQKGVFQLENIKFKIEDKLFPHCDKFIEKRMKKTLKQKLECAKTEEEKTKIIETHKNFILELRKEKHRKENMNYHLDIDNPQKTLYWLNINKDIHKRGLKKNFIKIPILITLLVGSTMSIFGNFNAFINIISIVGLTVESIGTFINTNCILLQNYNIKRVNRYIEGPYQKRKSKLEKKAIEYSGVTSVVSKTIRENEDIPQIEDVISNIQTLEQANKLLDLVQKEMSYREGKSKPKSHVKVHS